METYCYMKVLMERSVVGEIYWRRVLNMGVDEERRCSGGDRSKKS